MLLFHLSPYNLDGILVTPWIPNNFMTRNGFEDNKTKRIPVSLSIRGAIRALPLKRPGMHLWVNCTDVVPENVYCPTEDEVPDVGITEERWGSSHRADLMRERKLSLLETPVLTVCNITMAMV